MPQNIPDSTVNRLLAIQKFLREKTTPDAFVKQSQICDYLAEEYGFNVKRQTVSEYLELLSNDAFNYGLKCVKQGGGIKKYVYTGIFSEEQLSLIADIICSSTFLDYDTAGKLLSNIKSFVSDEKKEQFPDIDSYIRPHTPNFQSLQNIKTIHTAISQNRKISYYYANMNADKKLFYHTRINSTTACKKTYHLDRHNKIKTSSKIVDNSQNLIPTNPRTASPYKLLWDNSRCYLVAGLFDADGNFRLNNLRVDRMFDIQICGGNISDDEGVLEKDLRYFPPDNEFFNPQDRTFDTEKYLKSTFKMFTTESGKTSKLTFVASEKMAKSIVDRFGYDTEFKKSDADGFFTFSINIQPSKPFFSWLSQFSKDELSLVSPPHMIKQYKDFLKTALSDYPD